MFNTYKNEYLIYNKFKIVQVQFLHKYKKRHIFLFVRFPLFFFQYSRSRQQWLDDLHKEPNEKARLHIIDRFVANDTNSERVRLVNKKISFF